MNNLFFNSKALIALLNKYLLNVYYVPGTMLGTQGCYGEEDK